MAINVCFCITDRSIDIEIIAKFRENQEIICFSDPSVYQCFSRIDTDLAQIYAQYLGDVSAGAV